MLDKKVEAYAAVEAAITQYYLLDKSMALTKKNVTLGNGTLTPELLESFKAVATDCKNSLETAISLYISEEDLLSDLAATKLLDVYTKCLRKLRALFIDDYNSLHNRSTYVETYLQPKIQASEIADVSTLVEEMQKDLGTLEEDVQEEVERFVP